MIWAVGMAKVIRQTKPAELGRCRQHSRRTIRPAQASQQNNSQQMLAGLSPCSAGWWRECGGTGHSKGGLGPTYLSPSHLSPLPVTVHTHSLNLYKPNLAPTYFFVFFLLFLSIYFPTINRPLTPYNVLVRLTYLSPSLLPTPTFPSRRGIREG